MKATVIENAWSSTSVLNNLTMDISTNPILIPAGTHVSVNLADIADFNLQIAIRTNIFETKVLKDSIKLEECETFEESMSLLSELEKIRKSKCLVIVEKDVYPGLGAYVVKGDECPHQAEYLNIRNHLRHIAIEFANEENIPIYEIEKRGQTFCMKGYKAGTICDAQLKNLLQIALDEGF